MAIVNRRIGLSLGADLCWPICFEEIVNRLELAIPHDGDTVGIEVERVTIEPFDLRQGCRYDVVLDRLTHWYHTSREWIKKAVVMDDLYVLNNPWSVQSMEKHTAYSAMMRLGLPVPGTWMVPPKEYEPNPDLEPTLRRYARAFDLGEIGRRLGSERWYDPETRRINKRIRLSSADGRPRSYLESVRAYRRSEVVAALEAAGLEPSQPMGSFRGEPFDRDSERLIVGSRKPNGPDAV
jgi:hypothetical protein